MVGLAIRALRTKYQVQRAVDDDGKEILEHAIVQGEGGVGVDLEEKELVVVLDAMQILPTRSSPALHTTSHPFAAKVGHM